MTNYIFVSSPGDFEKFKSGTKFKFFCRGCGKLIHNERFIPNRKEYYKEFLCKSCNSKKIRKNNPDSWKKAVETNKRNHGGVMAAQLPEYRKRQSDLINAHPEWIIASIESNKNNHGGILFCQTEEGKEISRKNIINNGEYMKQKLKEKYGEKGSFGNKEIREKIKQTKLELYGNPNYVNPKKISETHRNRTKNEITISNIKRKQTKLELYGDPNYCNVEKIKQTKLNLYNNQYYVNPDKTKITRSNWSESKLLNMRQNRKSKIQFDGLKFDSSWEFAIYCYYKDTGHNIIHSNSIFNYMYNGEQHKYFPDFEIDGKTFEIKGNQFFKDKDPSNDLINPYDFKQNQKYLSKLQCMLCNGVNILTETDVRPAINYMRSLYTNSFGNLYNIHNINNVILGITPYNINNIPVNKMYNIGYVEPVTKWRTPFNINKTSKYV